MDYFGINSSEDLPKIKEVFAEQFIQPTLINDADFKTAEAADETNLLVNKSGDLVGEKDDELETG